MKKIYSTAAIILSVIMLLTLSGLTAFAEEVGTYEHQSGDYIYGLYDDDSAYIRKYTGSETKLVIPDELDGHPVTTINTGLLGDFSPVTEVTIPKGIKRIERQAFSGAESKLEKININAEGIYIDCDAFYETKFYNDKSNWEDGMLYIGKYFLAIDHEKLGKLEGEGDEIGYTYDIKVKSGTEYIASDFFGYFNLQVNSIKLTLPETVKKLCDGTLYNPDGCCPSIEVTILNKNMEIEDGALSCDLNVYDPETGKPTGDTALTIICYKGSTADAYAKKINYYTKLPTKVRYLDDKAPEITDGKNAEYTQGKGTGLKFRSTAAYADFIRVEVDGKEIDKANYTVSEGSTVVELKPEYLAKLSAGKHTLAIVSKSGTAKTDFTVVETGSKKSGGSPKTGNKSELPLILTLIVISGTVIVTVPFTGKRKFKHSR